VKKTVSFSKHAVNVFFHILTQCNLKCRYCYINPDQHGTSTLSPEIIKSWLNIFADKQKEANIIFLGGEPTLHPALPQAIRAARALSYKSITVDTNGYLFNDFLEKVTPPELDFISFSLDGATRETNDAIRGKGVYDVCIGGIRQAVARGFHTSLIYTVSSENIHELDQMGPLLSDLGIERFFIQVIGIRGKAVARQPEKLQVSRFDWLNRIPDVADKISRMGISVTYPKVFLQPGDSFECAGIVAENYFIFPNGRVYRCPLCEDYALHSQMIQDNRLVPASKINEADLFHLSIPEGCVMNKLIQPDNLQYNDDGTPLYKVACCLLKEEIY
jgi:MoaA/NifB/PqqE/SkfB family radical SAM enzyme